VIERLRRHPAACQAPLLIFGAPAGAGGRANPQTNLLTKPVPAQTLAQFVAALRPEQAGGPILIVDDDPHARAFYRAVVARALPGRPVIVAEGGAAALAAIAAQTPALVLLDLVMPEVDGFAVLERLRAAPATRQVPVIVLSGKLLADDDLRRLDHARLSVHSKDVLREDEIGDRLRRALDGAPQPAGQTSALVRRVCAYIQQHHARAISRQEIAQAVGVSPYYLSHIFQQELGLAPWEYLQRYRIARASELLQSTGLAVTEVAALVGFDDASYFGRVFRKHVGRSPQAFRDSPR
jgi:AraC-like DNA-binding protein